MMSPHRKKVLYLITKSNWGGAQRYVYDLATHLDQNQFEPVVALGGNGTLAELLHHAGIRTISIDSLERDVSIKKEWHSVKELWGVLRSERPDILHVNSSKAGGVGTVLGRLARVPRVIFTAHGWAFNEDRPAWQRIVIKGLHWLTVLFSHQTIAVSHALLEQMDWPGAQQKMKVINPGRTIGVMYDKSEARQHLAEIHPPLAEVKNAIWIMTIAELHPIKRLETLIAAMQKTKESVPKLRSVIIGDGELRAHLTTLIAQKGLSDRIFLTGNVAEAARFLKAADVFVLPSKSESYGYVLHEAGLAQIPVIATNVGGITDIISHDHTGRLIEVDDVAALSRELTDFVARQAHWKLFARNLHNVLVDRTVDQMTRRTSALYLLSLH